MLGDVNYFVRDMFGFRRPPLGGRGDRNIIALVSRGSVIVRR
jgi:hypothetical protein